MLLRDENLVTKKLQNKNRRNAYFFDFLSCFSAGSGIEMSIAPIGQKFWQLPHFTQIFGSMCALPSTNFIAPTGQIAMQPPQEMHFVLSTISFLLLYICSLA